MLDGGRRNSSWKAAWKAEAGCLDCSIIFIDETERAANRSTRSVSLCCDWLLPPRSFFCFAIDLSIGRYFFHLDVIHLRKRESPLAALRTCRVTAGVDARLGLILAGASDFLKVSALISAVTRSLSTDLQPTHVCGVASKMDERCRFGRSG